MATTKKGRKPKTQPKDRDQATEATAGNRKGAGPSQEVVKVDEPVKDLVKVEAPPVPKQQQKAEAALDLVAQGDDEINAFTAVALMLESMRTNLENIKYTGQPPRWVRIARAQAYKGKVIGDMVIELSGAFIWVVSFLAELTLQAQDLLKQIDSGRALMEVGIKMIETATDEKFLINVQKSVGIKGDPKVNVPAAVKDGLKTVDEVMKYIPDPEDVKEVAREMYRLLAVEEVDFIDSKSEEKPKYTTGKVRLLSWALDKPLAFHELTGGVKVERLGIRRLEKPDTQSEFKLTWNWKDEEPVILCDYKKEQLDQESTEVDKILKKLGYKTGNTKENLTAFQKKNELPKQDGSLDLHTINQLMNMDFKKKTLRRAKKFDEKVE
jgi:hypothetical protein